MLTVAIIFSALQLGVGPSNQASPLVDLASRYCFSADGDHRATWQHALNDDFRLLTSEDNPRLRLTGNFAANIRAFQRTNRGHEDRVLTTAGWVQSGDEGRSFFRYCWVSGSNESLAQVNRELRRELGGRYFRAEKTFVYAWIPRPDGTNEFVPRRVFMRRALTLAREQGMRQVTVRQRGDSVFIGYISPRDEATYRDFDWSGPDPVPAPERRGLFGGRR